MAIITDIIITADIIIITTTMRVYPSIGQYRR